ncbi:MAG: hypothetical protein ABI680_11095, partial [Chthoniobacteraceae bacterium]
ARTLENLGDSSFPVQLNNSQLSYSGAPDFTLTRELRTTDISVIASPAGPHLTLAAPISGPGGIQFRNGITLLADSTYEGPTQIYGSVTFDSDSSFGVGSSMVIYGQQVGAGTVLRPQGPWTTSRSIHLGGLTESYLESGEFDVVWNGPISSDVSYSGPFVKQGSGSLTLNADSKFGTSLRVEQGSLIVNGMIEGDSLNGNINVSPGATLSGVGEIQRDVFISGTLQPGDGVGVFSANDVSFADGSTFELSLISPEMFGQLDVEVAVNLNGQINLELELGYNPNDGVDSFVIIRNDAVDPVGGTGVARFSFGGSVLEEGSSFVLDGQAFQISYRGGSGNDVVLHALPEPAIAVFIIVGLGVLPWRRPQRWARGECLGDDQTGTRRKFSGSRFGGR